MKEIAHGVDEDCMGLFPAEWQIDLLRLQCQIKTLTVCLMAHRLQTSRDPLRIAMLAAWAHLITTRHRVPRGFCPFNT